MRAAAFALALFIAPAASARGEAPTLSPQRQLTVDGAPFLILGGELANSSASSLDYLRPHWADFEALHMNSVLAPVTWEQLEPREGAFDFTLTDGLLHDARAHHMHLVLLWFGSWKNSMSSYAPAWVKRDTARFPRARDASGVALEELSAFSEANVAADARAFAALMIHLRAVDAQHTVLMAQVENEIGMIPSARDHSAAANDSYAAAGAGDEERFMAAAFARYAQRVASAGKAAYPLPMYVNAALNRPGRAPGEYPAGGPLPHLYEIWRQGAPSIDMLSPDIYFPDFTHWVEAYRRADNPLFIPEANRAGAADAPANAFYAFGQGAIGFSPFAIDTLREPAHTPLAEAYAALAELAPLILAHQHDGAMVGVRAPVAFDGSVSAETQDVALGGYTLHVSFVDPWTPRADQDIGAHGGLIIALGADEFLIAGEGITATFAAPDAIVGLESVWEGHYAQGVWAPGRLLNGDETHQGRHVRLPPGAVSIQRVRVYRYR